MKRYFLFITILLLIHAFFMFYNLEKWSIFGWDQVDNAWAAMRILVAHKYPLLGMVAKQNSGLYIGPLYYYLVAIFYFFTRFDPIASPIVAGCTALFSFASPILAGCTALFSYWVIYGVSRRLFNKKVALISCFIYTFSSSIIQAERIQWPVNFIAPVGLLIFYFLYKVMTGNTKYIIHLAAAVGLSFHIHFTSVFYPIIILLSLPLIPINKKMWKYVFIAIPVFAVFMIPQAIYYALANHQNSLGNYNGYFKSYYHGFHLQRMVQLSHDAFIKFQSILEKPYTMLRNAVFLYIPLFFFFFLHKQKHTQFLKLFYLIALWILVPWIVFTTYSGEISDYYFNIQLYLAVILFAYLTVWIWETKKIILRAAIGIFWLYFAVANVQVFFNTKPGNLIKDRITVLENVNKGQLINFTEGDPKSYLDFYYSYTQHKPLPFNL
ncbi:MAG: glycosyltransferase family 39 protein [Candidatus Gottesmanbacteria bacterium]|nr:glycosyltransferase family 39 protein [Candidatus Gottesmanbacteria bacterium]